MCLKQLREMIDLQSPNLCNADLGASRTKRDEAGVQSIQELLENNWTNPFHSDPSDLVNRATGTTAPTDVTNDLLTATEKGEQAYQTIQKERFELRTQPFHGRLPKLQLKTFSSMKKSQREVHRKRKPFSRQIIDYSHKWFS